MADFEPPSFSLGLDFDLSDSDPHIPPVSISTLTDQDDNDFESLVVDDSEPEHPLEETRTYDVGKKCNEADSNSNLEKQNVSNACEDFPMACRYFFHDDLRIRELVRSRLPNFSHLGNMLNVELEQPGTSNIDYMGQFKFVEGLKQAAGNIETKKISRKSETEEMEQGWVNPKLGIDQGTSKVAVKRKARAGRRIAGHWLTGSDGKKVYVGKSGQELTGRVAYIQFKKESGLGFKKVKRKSVAKKKK